MGALEQEVKTLKKTVKSLEGEKKASRKATIDLESQVHTPWLYPLAPLLGLVGGCPLAGWVWWVGAVCAAPSLQVAALEQQLDDLQKEREREKQSERETEEEEEHVYEEPPEVWHCHIYMHTYTTYGYFDLIAMATTCRWQMSPPSMRMTVSRYQCSSQWRTDCEAA